MFCFWSAVLNIGKIHAPHLLALVALDGGHVGAHLGGVHTARAVAVKIPVTADVVAAPEVAQRGRDVPRGDLLAFLDGQLGAQLQAVVRKLDVVRVVQAGVVDQAVDGVQGDAGATLNVCTVLTRLP